MKWNSEEGYVQYKTVLNDLMSRLGLGAVDYHVRPELAPYITKILTYLDKELILLGDDAEILEKLNRIFDIFDYGADLIVDLNAETLAIEVGCEGAAGNVEETDDPDYVEYYSDRFIFSWTNVLSCLVTRLKLMYSGLLAETVSQGCYCCCGSKGETWKDWEAWSSGVYPEDEEYDKNKYQLGTTQNYGVSRGGSCTCGYRL